MTASLHDLFPQSAPYIREGSRAEKRAVLTLRNAANDDATEEAEPAPAAKVSPGLMILLAIGVSAVLWGLVGFLGDLVRLVERVAA